MEYGQNSNDAAFIIGIIVFGGAMLIDLIKGLFLTYPIPFIIRRRKNKE